jgi:hypothetical protein
MCPLFLVKAEMSPFMQERQEQARLFDRPQVKKKFSKPRVVYFRTRSSTGGPSFWFQVYTSNHTQNVSGYQRGKGESLHVKCSDTIFSSISQIGEEVSKENANVIKYVTRGCTMGFVLQTTGSTVVHVVPGEQVPSYFSTKEREGKIKF